MSMVFGFAQPLVSVVATDSLAQGRALRRYLGGWAAGAGDQAALGACLERLGRGNARTPATINALLAQSYVELARPAQGESTFIAYSYKVAGEFKLGSLTLAGTTAVPADTNILLSRPGDISTQVYEQAYAKITELLLSGKALNIFALIRALAGAYDLASRYAASVAGSLDLALMLRNDEGEILEWRLFAEAAPLISTDDYTLRTLLEQVG